MPKRTSTNSPKRRPTDPNQLAHLLVRESTEENLPENLPTTRKPVSKAVSKIMAQMGSKGGKIGGKRRLVTMTPEERSQIASDAARARWKKVPKT
jgi:hypothetical protein